MRKSQRLNLPTVTIDGKRLQGAYDQNMALKVLEAIAAGDTLKAVCERPEFPSYGTVQRWATIYPEFSKAYTEARRLRAASFEDEALGLARQLTGVNDFTGTRVRAFEVAMGQLRWSAARGDPAVYGSQQSVLAVVPIQINTTLDLTEGKDEENTKDYPQIFTIKARVAEPGAEPAYLTAPEDPALEFGDKAMVPMKKLHLDPNRVRKGPKPGSEAAKRGGRRKGTKPALAAKGETPYSPPDPDLSYKLPREENE